MNVPPHNTEAEGAVLGGIMLDNSTIEATLGLAPEDFYSSVNKVIFQAIMALYAKRQPADLLSISDALKKSTELSDAGGVGYLAQLIDLAVTATNTGYYAKLVRDASLLRNMASVCRDIAATAMSHPRDVMEFIEDAGKRFFAALSVTPEQYAVRLGDTVVEFYKTLERMQEQGSRLTGLNTGLEALNEMTGGFRPSNLIILAARPGAGKSSLALNIAEYVTIHSKEPKAVVFFSLEMAREELERRLYSSMAKIDLWRLNRGMVHKWEMAPLTNAGNQIDGCELWVDDSAALTPNEVGARMRKLVRQGLNLGLIIVDYLQLMRVPGSKSREQEVAEISRALKALAKEFKMPVLALAQLNREVEQRNPPIPRLSDLRDSGQIEQDADLILFLYRQDIYQTDLSKRDGTAKLIIAKQRNGPTGAIDLKYIQEQTKFVDQKGE